MATEIIIKDADIKCLDLSNPPNGKALYIEEKNNGIPTGTVYIIPMGEEAAKIVSNMLAGSKIVVAGMPLPKNGKFN